jgi:integrase
VHFDVTRSRWVGQVWLDGRRRKVTAKTKADAARALGKLIHGDQGERDVDRRVTVAKLLVEWQAKALGNRTRAPSTIERHAWAAARLTAAMGNVKVVELTSAKIERALATMAEDGLSRASLTEVRGTLRQALTWAVRRRLVAWNAADAAELPEGAKGPRAKRALSPEEVTALLGALREHPWLAMYALMGRLGLRPGEAAGVCADAVDVDGDPPTVAVIRAVHLAKGRPVLAGDLKTAGSRRTIAIPADVAAMLKPLAARDGLLFVAEGGGPVWPNLVRRVLSDACTRAEVPKVSPNELRHTAATNLVNAGVPMHTVADILGHSSMRMLDATYRHRPAVIRGADSIRP